MKRRGYVYICDDHRQPRKPPMANRLSLHPRLVSWSIPLQGRLLDYLVCFIIIPLLHLTHFLLFSSLFLSPSPSFPFFVALLSPFRDQPGCKFKSCVEPNPVLQTLVAALSSGPIGPSDQIGKLNVGKYHPSSHFPSSLISLPPFSPYFYPFLSPRYPTLRLSPLLSLVLAAIFLLSLYRLDHEDVHEGWTAPEGRQARHIPRLYSPPYLRLHLRPAHRSVGLIHPVWHE